MGETQKDSSRRKAAPAETPEPAQAAIPTVSKETIAAEREILMLLINSIPEVVEFALGAVKHDEFLTSPHKLIFENIISVFSEFGEVSVPVLLSRTTEPEASKILSDISIDKYTISERWEELLPEQKDMRPLMLQNFIDALKKLRVSKLENTLLKLIEKSRKSVSEEEKKEILREIVNVNTQKSEVITELSRFREQ